MIDHITCQNCVDLKSQCLLLKEEIIALNRKLDNLLDAVCRDKIDKSCQTPFSSCQSLSTQTVISTLSNTHQLTTNSNSQTNDILSLSTDSHNHITEVLSKPTLDTSLSVSMQDEILMDIFTKSSKIENNIQGVLPKSYATPLIILPYISLPNQPFSNFELSALDKDSNFDVKLHNRSLCYYGISNYCYNGVKHQSKPIPESGNYLNLILDHLKSILPDFQFNSVLLTKYNNGSDCLGFHSDNEPEIMPNSDIVTISLGQPRVMKFRCPPVYNEYQEHELTLNHGDVVIMSRNSQNIFEHSIIADDSLNPRISITFRLLNADSGPHSFNNTSSSHEVSTSAPIESAITDQNESENYTLYIGDSMIKSLNSQKMSSSSQKAVVFAYSGATAEGIQSKLRNDPRFLKLDPAKVTKIFILCGTNSVDKVLHVPFHMNSEFLGMENYQPTEHVLQYAKTGLTHLANFLHAWANSASINFINILPRESGIRNIVINLLNSHITTLANNTPFISMVSTEKERNLFTFKNGFRKNNFFHNQGEDNVHLSSSGITRLAKHLKYIAHH